MAYRQLDSDDRERIEFLYSKGHSQAYIARQVGVHRSTISKELKRNSVKGRYDAWTADLFTKERKQRPSGYLPCRKSRSKVYRLYVAPYKKNSWFDRVIRKWKEKKRQRKGRKKIEWRVTRRDACQFNRTQEDMRFRRGTHVKAWRKKKQQKRRRRAYRASLFRTSSLFKAYYPPYPAYRKRRDKARFRIITRGSWGRKSYSETYCLKIEIKKPLRKNKPLRNEPVAFVQAEPEVSSLMKTIHPLPAKSRPLVRKKVKKSAHIFFGYVTPCAKSAKCWIDPSPP